MIHLHNYESLNESKDMDTIKKMVLDYAEKNGKSKWKELQSLIVKHNDLDPNDRSNRGYFSSYFSGGSDFISKYHVVNMIKQKASMEEIQIHMDC